MRSSAIESVLAALPSAKPAGKGQWIATCPSHDDRRASLSVGVGDDDRALIRCHAGCSTVDVVAALGLKMADLMPNGDGAAPTKAPAKPKPIFPTARAAVEALERRHGPRSAAWTYWDTDGKPAGTIVRWDLPDGGKRILPVSRNGSGWSQCGMPVPRPLFCLRELADASAVYICEGEKVVMAARTIELAATTSAHGSASAAKTDWSPLAGKECVILPDIDGPGRKYATTVAHLLRGLNPRPGIKIVELPDLSDGDDLVGWLAAGGTREELEKLVERAPEWKPPAAASNDNSPSDRTSTPKPDRETPQVTAFQEFPVSVLPEPLRDFINIGAASMNCDVSFIALPLLAATASAIGNARSIELKPGWQEPSILWAAIIGESGCVKTPAFKLAVKPLRQRQSRALKRHGEEIARHEVLSLQHEKKLTIWKRDQHLADQPPEKPERPEAERCIISDATVEAVAPILVTNPRGVLLARDELSGWFGSFDRYVGGKHGADSSYWLSMHNGESLIVDRKTGPKKIIFVPSALVSITGAVQPGILRRVMSTGEHRESGLLARLLLAMPPRRVKRWTEAEISPSAEATIALLFERLFALEPDQDEAGEPQPRILRMTPTAKRTWIAFFNEHAEEHAELSGDLSAAWSKLEGYAPRLALVIHCIRAAAGDPALEDTDRVDEISMLAGITLSRWFGSEARRVYAAMAESDRDGERRQLIELIERKGGEITARKLMQASRAFDNSNDATAALQELVDSALGEWVTPKPGPRGGHPSKKFKLAASTVHIVYANATPPRDPEIGGSVSVDNSGNVGDDWGVV